MAKRNSGTTTATTPARENCFTISFVGVQTKVCKGIRLEDSSPDRAVYCGERFVPVARTNGAHYRKVDGMLLLTSATVDTIHLETGKRLQVLVRPSANNSSYLVKIDQRPPNGIRFRHRFWTEVRGGTHVVSNLGEHLYEVKVGESLTIFRADGSVMILTATAEGLVHELMTGGAQALLRLNDARALHETSLSGNVSRRDAAVHEIIEVLSVGWDLLEVQVRDATLEFLIAEANEKRISNAVFAHVKSALTSKFASWVITFGTCFINAKRGGEA